MLVDPATCTVPTAYRLLAGTTLHPVGDPDDIDRTFAVFETGDARLGVRIVWDEETDTAHALYSPNARIPDIGRARKDFRRFCYEGELDALDALELDDRDGEVTFEIEELESPADAERAIERHLAELPAVRAAIQAYVGACIDEARREAA